MAPKIEPDAKLRPLVKLALRAWYDGTDLATMLPKATLYKYRREILDATGIDVLLTMKEQSDSTGPALLGIEELRVREVIGVPARIQRSLFGAG